jgi:transcriptional regulator with GAF, ATPase, and Fis domain
MFRREQLSDEALLAIGAHGTLQKTTPPARLLDLIGEALQPGGAGHVELDAIERQLLREAVEAEGGNLAAAARRLGITRAQLAYRLQRLEQPPA